MPPDLNHLPLTTAHRAAGWWAAATITALAGAATAMVAAAAGAIDLTVPALLLLAGAHGGWASRRAWCRGWADRGLREIHNQLLETRPR